MKLANILNNFIGGTESYPTPVPPVPPVPMMPRELIDTERREITQDQVTMSQDAAFYLAAREYNPEYMTSSENRELADLLFDAGAISIRDHAILLNPPKARDAVLANSTLPRNYLADWQMRMAADIGHSNIGSVDAAGRALSILGRVSSVRADAA